MLGFHSDGIRLVHAPETLIKELKNRKLPMVNKSTGNTFVFAIDDAEIVQKRPYNISFSAVTTPWFVCSLQQDLSQIPLSIAFGSEMDLAEWIQALYFSSQEFLHLDIELSVLKQTFSKKSGVLRAYHECEFAQIPKNTPVICFYFGNGGFLETDRIFAKLIDSGVSMNHITLAGSFASQRQYLVAFAIES